MLIQAVEGVFYSFTDYVKSIFFQKLVIFLLPELRNGIYSRTRTRSSGLSKNQKSIQIPIEQAGAVAFMASKKILKICGFPLWRILIK